MKFLSSVYWVFKESSNLCRVHSVVNDDLDPHLSINLGTASSTNYFNVRCLGSHHLEGLFLVILTTQLAFLVHDQHLYIL